MTNKKRRDRKKRRGGREGEIGSNRGVSWETWIGINRGVGRNRGI